MKLFKIFLIPLKYLGICLIYLYKYTINLIMPRSCIYYPSCSTYGLIAIKRFGIFKGSYLIAKRIFRCKPSYCGGFDPVPDNLETNLKFIV